MEIKQTPIESLIPYARNARTHSDAQVAQIAASIREFGWTNPVLVDGSNGIIAGHGRVLAARKLGLAEVPTIELAHLNEAQKRAYVLADNRISLNAGWDESMLALEVSALELDGFDLDLTGFDAGEIEDLLNGDRLGGGEQIKEPDDTYTREIRIPVYEPKNEKPKVSDLYDEQKTLELRAQISEADLPKDVRRFLEVAADRHTVFHFARIADFYAHSEPEIQDLMERSALVIIDFQKAIENGFVHLTERLGELVDIEQEGSDA